MILPDNRTTLFRIMREGEPDASRFSARTRLYLPDRLKSAWPLEIGMRTLLFTVAAAAVSAVFNAGAAQAETYPFCRNNGGAGPGDCKYVTYDQCLMAISGVGGFCQPNYWTQPSNAPVDERLLRSGHRHGSRP